MSESKQRFCYADELRGYAARVQVLEDAAQAAGVKRPRGERAIAADMRRRADQVVRDKDAAAREGRFLAETVFGQRGGPVRTAIRKDRSRVAGTLGLKKAA